MDNREELKCNEHVKAYQRQQLIEWLEGAKAERIRQLHEKPTHMPTAKVDVPSPDIVDEGIDISPVMTVNTDAISTSLVNIQPENTTPYFHFAIPTQLFEGIYFPEEKKPEPLEEVSVEIDSRDYSSIITSISVPDNSTLPETTFDPLFISVYSNNYNISPTTIPIPTDGFSILSDSIVGSQSIKTPEKTTNLITDIHILQDFDPACIHFEKADIKSPLDVRPEISSVQGVLPELAAISPVEISTESMMVDFSLSIDLKTIPVPSKTDNTDFMIDVKKQDYSILVPTINVPQSQLEVELDTEIGTINNVSVPEVVVSESVDLAKKVDVAKVEMPETNISVPSPYSAPEITIQPIDVSITSQSNYPIYKTDLSDVSCSLPVCNPLTDISVPSQGTKIFIENNIPDMPDIQIPTINATAYSRLAAETQKIQFSEEIAVDKVSISTPHYIPISKNDVCAISYVPSIAPISPPSKVRISDNASNLSLSKLTVPSVTIPDNSSFLDHLNRLQEHNAMEAVSNEE